MEMDLNLNLEMDLGLGLDMDLWEQGLPAMASARSPSRASLAPT